MKYREVYHSCQLCRDTGWVMAESLKYKTIYAFRCGMCGAADRLRLSTKSIPVWSSQFKNEFKPIEEAQLA